MLVSTSPPEHFVFVHDIWRPLSAPKAPSKPRAAPRPRPSNAPAKRTLALSLQRARIGATLTQEELARAVNVPVKRIQDIEASRARFPPKPLLQTIGGVLGVDLLE